MNNDHGRYRVVLLGGSSGAMSLYREIFPALSKDFPLAVIVVQHLHPQQSPYHIDSLADICALPVTEVFSHEEIQAGHIYFAPANYHLLIERDNRFSLSVDAKVNFSRPSIDVSFESAATVYGKSAIGVILSGANNDGAFGLSQIKHSGGLAIVQDPHTAESKFMPEAALDLVAADHIVGPARIAPLLAELTHTTDHVKP